MRQQIANTPKLDEFDKLKGDVADNVSNERFLGLNGEVQGLVSRDEFDCVDAEIRHLRKDIGALLPRDECFKRLNLMSECLKSEIQERPTFPFVKKLIAGYNYEKKMKDMKHDIATSAKIIDA